MMRVKTMYKLYIGGYDEKHNQPLTLIEETPKKSLLINVRRLLDVLPYGLDLYIEKPDKTIYAWHGDLTKYAEKEIQEMLK